VSFDEFCEHVEAKVEGGAVGGGEHVAQQGVHRLATLQRGHQRGRLRERKSMRMKDEEKDEDDDDDEKKRKEEMIDEEEEER
jgi:hypothetical protein